MSTSGVHQHSKQDVWMPLYAALMPFGLSRADIDSLLGFVLPPPTITSFAVIAENLLHVLRYAAAIEKAASHPDRELVAKCEKWAQICEVIVSQRPVIEKSLPELYKRGRNPSSPPFRGYYESHPLGVALWCSVADHELKARYSLLQGYLCLAFHLLRPLERRNALLHADAKYRACCVTRKLAHPVFTDKLREFPTKQLDFRSYRRQCAVFEEDVDLLHILKLFDFALEVRKGRVKSSRSQRRARSSDIFNEQTQAVEYIDEVNAEPVERLNILTVSTAKGREKSAQENLLCKPEEFSQAREYVSLEQTGPDPSGGLSISQQRLMAKGASSAVSMHNQRLPCDWDQLTHHEIVCFIEAIRDLSCQDREIDCIPAKELAAFLAIVFWISADTTRASETTLVPAAARCTTALGIQMGSDGSNWWVIKPHVPPLKHVPKRIIEMQALQLAKRYTLEMPPEAAAVIGRHISGIHLSHDPKNVFERSEESLVKAADGFFRSLRRREKGRQSLQRVSSCIHNLLAQLPGSDITAAMSITGRNDPLGAVPLHYTANDIVRLQQLYSMACKKIIGTGTASLAATKITGMRGASYYVGSGYVPKQDTVSLLVTDLRDRLGKARIVAKNEGNPILLHNSMVLYTVLMIGFATGYRAVRDPLLQEAEIDRSTGFAIISDKDSDDYYNARIIWLPEICLRQLDLYKEHVKHLQGWLFKNNQTLFFNTRQQALTGRLGIREFPTLFLMEKNCNELSLQPKLLHDLLKRINYQLPMNSNRHYLRTNLVAGRCPVEVIDAFLGHWQRGREPWGRYSGFSPIDYREALSRHLLPLLERCGWVPEAGFGTDCGK